MSDYNRGGNIGCLIVFIFIFLSFAINFSYVKQNKAPSSCMFARDVVTCVQISKKGSQQ